MSTNGPSIGGGTIQSLTADIAKGFFGNDYVRDYAHAAKTFRTNSYENAPKLKFLFHVYFDINPAVYSVGLSSGVNHGLAVKQISLPKFNFDTHVMNQYNRKRIVQTKLKYNPISLSFHDDNKNSVNNMWYNYYTYYFKDADKSSNTGSSSGTDYNARNLYNSELNGSVDWGYVGEARGIGASTKIPFFKSIQVYGFNQHSFVRYSLINPMITSFEHDTYNYSEASGIMENRMTIDYETVKYAEGALNGKSPGDVVTGFGLDANYDTTLSPISRQGSNATILGRNGLVDAADGILNDLSSGTVSGLINAVRTTGTTINTFKNTNITKLTVNEIKGEIAASVVNSLPNTIRSANGNFPGYNASPGPTTRSGTTYATPVSINTTGTGIPTNTPVPPGVQVK